MRKPVPTPGMVMVWLGLYVTRSEQNYIRSELEADKKKDVIRSEPRCVIETEPLCHEK